MRCSQCEHENPFGNFFCGHCGAPLLQRPPAPPQKAPEQDAAAPEPPQPAGHITGPSFLGLSEQQVADDRSLEYLYEDEPTRRYGRLIVAILVLVAFGTFIAYQWKQRPNWYTDLNNPLRRPAAESPVERASAGVPTTTSSSTEPTAGNGAAVPPGPAATAPTATSPTQLTPALPASKSGPPSTVPQADSGQPSAANSPGDSPPAPTTPATDEGDVLLARGLAYLNGTGVPRNCSHAIVYLNSAARRGNTKANSQLGGLYATGHCVPMDRARAYQYFTRARNAEHGRNVYIEHNREMLWSQMNDAEKAQARAAQ